MPTYTKLSRYDRNEGTSGASASSSVLFGTCSSSTMIVMMIAITPSENASSRVVPTRLDLLQVLRQERRHALQAVERGRQEFHLHDAVGHAGQHDVLVLDAGLGQ